MNKYKRSGWRGESQRHSLARKGIKTKKASFLQRQNIGFTRALRKHPYMTSATLGGVILPTLMTTPILGASGLPLFVEIAIGSGTGLVSGIGDKIYTRDIFKRTERGLGRKLTRKEKEDIREVLFFKGHKIINFPDEFHAKKFMEHLPKGINAKRNGDVVSISSDIKIIEPKDIVKKSERYLRKVGTL